MNYRFKIKIILYTIIKTKSVTIVYVYMYFLFYNLVGICVLMCLGVVCPRYAAGVDHAHYTAHIVNSSFVSSNRILPFVYTFSGIFVELLKVIQSAGMC